MKMRQLAKLDATVCQADIAVLNKAIMLIENGDTMKALAELKQLHNDNAARLQKQISSLSMDEILLIVFEATGVDVPESNNTDHHVFARYVAILMMDEEGYKPAEIDKKINIRREHVYTILKRAAKLIRTNRTFKNTYLACITRMAQLEQTNEIEVYKRAV